jgi:hypothetical protein
LEKIKVSELRCVDHHASSPLQRIDADGADFGLAVAKVEATLAPQVGDAVLVENAAHMLLRFVQIAGTENRVAR